MEQPAPLDLRANPLKTDRDALQKALALVKQKPLVAGNHLEGHALTARFTDAVAFPYLLLLVLTLGAGVTALTSYH